jgi:two-component system, OmpR family, phosphate regulon sensor histidine kinase PhoR
VKRKKLIWQLYPSYLLIILLSLGGVTWYSLSVFEQAFLRQTSASLETKAVLLTQTIQSLFPFSENQKAIDSFCKELSKKIATRITIILPDGTVIADSEKNPSEMENHQGRIEIQQAIKGVTGQSIRYSTTLQEDMMYVALPVFKDSKISGVVRTALPLTILKQAQRHITFQILISGFLISLFAAILSFLISRRIGKSLEKLKEGAERFAQGLLQAKIPLCDSMEMSRVAEAMNQMADQLEERIQTIRLQQNEQNAVFSSMTESVLALDNEEKILNFNQAAGLLFTIPLETGRGRSVQEVIRNPDLERFLKKAFENTEPIEAEIVIREEEERILQARSSLLKNAEGKRIGILIVMNDITKLKKLETIRKDFVANVSHELRTPVTSIKGFIETLKNGAVNDPSEREHFLDILLRQTDRLNAILEDLLSLSRIEQESEKDEIILETGDLKKMMGAAIQNCQKKAEEKNIRIIRSGEENILVKMNPSLIEQALTNLIDNAIKYSDEGKEIRVSVRQTEKQIQISVQDFGCGISKEHLSRIFERFYRVDKARSRKMGGTGLGLSIVKHIVQAHKGEIKVESTPGKGSTFSLYLTPVV